MDASLQTRTEMLASEMASQAKTADDLNGLMRYDENLRRGYPIASRVIEGARRHLVKDRRDAAECVGRLKERDTCWMCARRSKATTGECFWTTVFRKRFESITIAHSCTTINRQPSCADWRNAGFTLLKWA